MKKPLMILVLIAVALFALPAYADDVDITVVPDKTSYSANEVITLNVTVTNNTDMVMKNLNISNVVPEGLTYVDPSEANETIAEVMPDETVEHQIRLTRNNSVVPSTGDHAMPTVWLVLICMSVACIAVIGKRKFASAKIGK